MGDMIIPHICPHDDFQVPGTIIIEIIAEIIPYRPRLPFYLIPHFNPRSHKGSDKDKHYFIYAL